MPGMVSTHTVATGVHSCSPLSFLERLRALSLSSGSPSTVSTIRSIQHVYPAAGLPTVALLRQCRLYQAMHSFDETRHNIRAARSANQSLWTASHVCTDRVQCWTSEPSTLTTWEIDNQATCLLAAVLNQAGLCPGIQCMHHTSKVTHQAVLQRYSFYTPGPVSARKAPQVRGQ